MVLRQATRPLNIATTLGDDEIQLLGFAGQEELSRLFEFQLEVISFNSGIKAELIVGQNLTFSTDRAEGEPRFFNGYVSRFRAGNENDNGHRHYFLTVVPWFWFLTQTIDCRIFQEVSVVQIVEEIFRDHGFEDFEFRLTGWHPPREYCVQYRESDFDFVSRLLEEEGIFYFFRHRNGKHEMVLGDNITAWDDCEESPVDFPSETQQSGHVHPHITAWQHEWQFRSGAWAHSDYNFKMPRQVLLSSERTLMQIRNATGYERFEYPGCFPDRELGKPLARVRMEEIESGHDLVFGSSNCKTFFPGGRFVIGKHQIHAEEKQAYVLKLVEHEARDASYASGDGGTTFSYRNNFQCFPDSVAFRPERITPKALMRGCQTAVVTGPEGEEIHTDEFGRVKVKFHWDRWGPCDDRSSCWVRVSQPHAGAGWGHIDLPRVGEEVIVDFLEGDPDRPIIVGRVYNGCNRVPYNLPQNKTISGYKSKSYKEDGKNEMLIDDTAGKEQIIINAQKDMHTKVANDQSLFVGNNRNEEITTDDGLKVGGDKTTMVTGACYTSSGGLMTLVSDTEVFIGCGASYIKLSPGDIEIGSKIIRILGDALVSTEASLVQSKASGQNVIKGGVVIIN